MKSVAVIDYGMGNLHSIAKALQHADHNTNVIVTCESDRILKADRVVFPGVGAIHDCMEALEKHNLVTTLNEIVKAKPLLGICLGMQALLTDSQESGQTSCLNLLQGHVLRFNDPLKDKNGAILKVPHMGWNQVKQNAHPLWENIPDNSRFYFVHSYYASVNDKQIIAATSDYPNPFCLCASQRKYLCCAISS